MRYIFYVVQHLRTDSKFSFAFDAMETLMQRMIWRNNDSLTYSSM